MKPVGSLRSLRPGIPAALLCVTGVAFAIGLWQSVAHQRTLATLETSLRKAPRREELSDALCQLLPLLQGDVHPPGTAEERLAAARVHRERFAESLGNVSRVVLDQQHRWQELMAFSRRRREVDAATKALFMSLTATLWELADHSSLMETESPRRAQTITAFREKVFELLELIRQSQDPASRLIEQYNDARDRVEFSYQLTGFAAGAGILLALVLYRRLQRMVWKPLQSLERSLAAVAHGDYQGVGEPGGVVELRRMFDLLASIRDRCACTEQDKDREVEDRCNQKVRSERLAGIGLLATGVAHEINNPLTAIVGAADGLAYRMADVAAALPAADGEIVREYLGMIQAEAKRCRGITTKLLDFARGREGERALYDLTAIVQEVVGMFRHVRQYQSRTIEVNRHDPCRAFCNGPEIKQVVLNLVANALQATAEGGRLDIRINPLPDVVEVVFKDTGSGMSPETLEHVFDPFFSTKGPGQGTGLGLSISHAIVEKHLGTLEATSAGPGLGSTFRLRLPASEDAARTAAERRAA